jgi:hypothetical protein
MEVLYQLSYRGIFSSWGREDSNLRRRSRQIYSLLPLAARAHPRARLEARAPKRPDIVANAADFSTQRERSLGRDSNPRPAAYKAAALPLSYPGVSAFQHVTGFAGLSARYALAGFAFSTLRACGPRLSATRLSARFRA